MATTQFTTTAPISSAANAVAVKNRLSRDLDELQRAAAGAATLPADDAGVLFDLTVNLHQATEALAQAIKDVDTYIANERAARQARQAAIAAEFNADIFGIAA